jgi:hypothetical protein
MYFKAIGWEGMKLIPVVQGKGSWWAVHKEKSNKMQECIKFYYSIFI